MNILKDLIDMVEFLINTLNGIWVPSSMGDNNGYGIKTNWEIPLKTNFDVSINDYKSKINNIKQVMSQ